MNKASNKEQKIAKSLIVLGDNHVGKSSIITQFTKERFSEDYKSTIGVYFQSKEIKILNQTVYLSIWDVNGEEIKNTILDSRIYANAIPRILARTILFLAEVLLTTKPKLKLFGIITVML